MKFAASVSLAALALAGCAVDSSGTPVAAVPDSAAAPQASDGLPHPLTAEGARQFIADVRKRDAARKEDERHIDENTRHFIEDVKKRHAVLQQAASEVQGMAP